MPITYKHLTPEQQKTITEQAAFSAEHEHLAASLELKADPANAEKQAVVAKLETKITVLHAEIAATLDVIADAGPV